tara:strand:- start:400 stop:600 length:201 start_codon:yes stop_codon:yes gene_type:complete
MKKVFWHEIRERDRDFIARGNLYRAREIRIRNRNCFKILSLSWGLIVFVISSTREEEANSRDKKKY